MGEPFVSARGAERQTSVMSDSFPSASEDPFDGGAIEHVRGRPFPQGSASGHDVSNF